MEPTKAQRQAAQIAVSRGLSVIVGGAGTGKSTAVRLVCELADVLGLKVYLAAPTGRAAARLADVTGRPCSTIHKLLGAKMDGTYETKQIEADVVVVDEMSLVDVFLFEQILSSLRPDARLVLVGDQEQLGSVGPGAVLRDVISSRRVGGMRLGKVQRQAMESGIVRLARDISRGKVSLMPYYEDDKHADVSWWDAGTAEEIDESMVELFQSGCQIITPRRTGIYGSEELSRRIREQALKRKGGLSVGDLVRLRSGDYAWKGAGLGAGATGRVVALRGSYGRKTAVVDFSGREIEYHELQWDRLAHGWAATVHVSQGGEWDSVGLLLHPSAGRLLVRSVLYTAVTRASHRLVLFGERASWVAAVGSIGIPRRTGLGEMLRA